MEPPDILPAPSTNRLHRAARISSGRPCGASADGGSPDLVTRGREGGSEKKGEEGGEGATLKLVDPLQGGKEGGGRGHQTSERRRVGHESRSICRLAPSLFGDSGLAPRLRGLPCPRCDGAARATRSSS